MEYKMNKCPVCGEEIVTDYIEFMEGYILMEKQMHCKDHYFYSFEYGYWTEVVNGVEKTGSWDSEIAS
jgi:hypothetical protein